MTIERPKIYINANTQICNDCGKPTSVNLDFCPFCGNRDAKVRVIYPAPALPASRPRPIELVA